MQDYYRLGTWLLLLIYPWTIPLTTIASGACYLPATTMIAIEKKGPARQLQEDTRKRPGEDGGEKRKKGDDEEPKEDRPRRFYGSVRLDATRLGRDAGKIEEEVVQNLSGIVGAEVEITLEIHAEILEGAPENVVRTITENCKTLRFNSHEFEES